MNRKSYKRVLPAAMAAMTLLSSMPVHAADVTNIGSFDVGEGTSKQSEVLYSQDSDFTVTIPKKIALGSDKSAAYNVLVKGSVRADEKVTVYPDTEFAMHDAVKADVMATATQKDTVWSCTDITEAGTAKSGTVSAEKLTAGDWSGDVRFYINLDNDSDNPVVGHKISVSQDSVAMGTDGSVQVNAFVDGELANDSVVWESDNANIVVNNGLVETKAAAKVGDKATVTVSLPETAVATMSLESDTQDVSEQTSIDFTVTIVDIEYSVDEVDIKPGESQTVTAKILPEGTVGTVSWSTTAVSGLNLAKNGNTVTIKAADDMTVGSKYNVIATFGDYSRMLGVNIIDNHVHSYVESITKQATCIEDGLKTFTCECGDSYTEVIKALGHDFSEEYTIDVPATCKTVGSKSQHCSRCDEKRNVTEIPAGEHNYVKTIVKAATCTEDGSARFTCSECNDTYTEVIPATGHNFVNDVCQNCGAEGPGVMSVTATNQYVAKSRGGSVTLSIPDVTDVSCTTTSSGVTISGTKVTVSADSVIGTIIPVTLKNNATSTSYIVRVIVAPDVVGDSYAIYNANDLVALRNIANYGAKSDVNQNAKLMNDIDLSSVCSASVGNWIPIGNKTATPYLGNFDGQNHTISNLYRVVSYSSPSGTLYDGLFGYIKSQKFENLTLEGQISITVPARSTSTHCVGAVVGGVSSNITKFTNINNKCSVRMPTASSKTYIGGICGSGGGSFTDCINSGVVYSNTSGYAGGIAGHSSANFVNCANSASITGYMAGGIDGYSIGNYALGFRYCTNTGYISGTSSAAGIVSYGQSAIFRCVNKGTISGSGAGGIAYFSGIKTSECVNYGKVSATGTGSSNNCGGIVGNSLNPVIDCYNMGTINSKGTVGGIVCYSQGIIKNCYDAGTLTKPTSTSTWEPGGIFGSINMTHDMTYENCFTIYKAVYGNCVTNYKLTLNNVKAGVSADDMKTYADQLGDNFVADTTGINNGYPVLKWQVEAANNN